MLKTIVGLGWIALICMGFYIAYHVYLGDYKDTSEMVGLIIASVALIVISGFGLFFSLFGDWLMVKMYGSFSNRNPWGY